MQNYWDCRVLNCMFAMKIERSVRYKRKKYWDMTRQRYWTSHVRGGACITLRLFLNLRVRFKLLRLVLDDAGRFNQNDLI